MSARTARRWLLAASACLMACSCGGQTATVLPPTGQIVLHVDTDATLPPAPGTLAATDAPPWLINRLNVDVLRNGAPVPNVVSLAERDFALHLGRFEHGPVSLGIVPEPGEEGLVARVRLFRGDRLVDGKTPERAVLDTSVALPVVQPEGKLDVFVFLGLDDVGAPQEVASPERTVPATSRVGTWPGAAVTPCGGDPGEGEACVPGGAFWMGDPLVRGIPELGDANEEHLVVVSPFYVDLAEVTVASFRKQRLALLAAGHEEPPTWSGARTGTNIDDYSTYTPAPDPNDPGDTHAALPVNGVTWDTARAYCKLVGKDLPTEAMYEFLASNRGLETGYVWGNDEPTCGDLVCGRAGFGWYRDFPGPCRGSTDIGGPSKSGSTSRDRIPLGGRVVLDLAGNLSEWSRDYFLAQGEGIWGTAGPQVDPEGKTPGAAADQRTSRGGSWRGLLIESRSAARNGKDPTKPNRSMGFRCARQ